MAARPTVLIADKFEASGVAELERLGCNVTVRPDLDAATLPAALAELQPEVLVVRSTKVPAGVIEGAASLRGIVRAGSGYDNIDTDAAAAKGVAVCNCPGMNAVAVAELTIGHLIGLDRRIPEQDAELRAGHWNKKEYSKARGLKGRHLLVIGTGAIGTEVIQRAKAFGMRVHAQSRSLRDETARALGIEPIEYTREALHRALPDMDAVSVHVASTPDTRDLCDRAFFGAMKPGAIFINTSRGDIVDEPALVDAVSARGLRAAIDVYRDQPSEKQTAWSTPVASATGVLHLSHHCGASTDQAQLAVAEEVCRIVREFRDHARFVNVVNNIEPASA
ncbi:MAG: NAD(P)-dependent oxidoreductase [Planctomycetota bacterium]